MKEDELKILKPNSESFKAPKTRLYNVYTLFKVGLLLTRVALGTNKPNFFLLKQLCCLPRAKQDLKFDY